MTGALKDQVNTAVERMTGTRFCLHCQQQRPVEGFRIVPGVKRERCATCAAKTEATAASKTTKRPARRVGG